MTLNGADNGKHNGMILIDLQKAFDTLDHTILLEKMKCIGFFFKKKDGFVLTSQTWSNGLVVKVLHSQFRSLWFNTTGWLQG